MKLVLRLALGLAVLVASAAAQQAPPRTGLVSPGDAPAGEPASEPPQIQALRATPVRRPEAPMASCLLVERVGASPCVVSQVAQECRALGAPECSELDLAGALGWSEPHWRVYGERYTLADRVRASWAATASGSAPFSPIALELGAERVLPAPVEPADPWRWAQSGLVVVQTLAILALVARVGRGGAATAASAATMAPAADASLLEPLKALVGQIEGIAARAERRPEPSPPPGVDRRGELEPLLHATDRLARTLDAIEVTLAIVNTGAPRAAEVPGAPSTPLAMQQRPGDVPDPALAEEPARRAAEEWDRFCGVHRLDDLRVAAIEESYERWRRANRPGEAASVQDRVSWLLDQVGQWAAAGARADKVRERTGALEPRWPALATLIGAVSAHQLRLDFRRPENVRAGDEGWAVHEAVARCLGGSPAMDRVWRTRVVLQPALLARGGVINRGLCA